MSGARCESFRRPVGGVRSIRRRKPRAAAYFLAKRQEGICKPFSTKGYNYLPPPHETPWRGVFVRLARFYAVGVGGGRYSRRGSRPAAAQSTRSRKDFYLHEKPIKKP